MNESFGDRLRRVRKERNLTTQQLGDLLNISNQQVSNYENGKSLVRADILVSLCELLGVSADFLLFGRIGESAVSKDELIKLQQKLLAANERINELQSHENDRLKNRPHVSDAK